MRVLLFPDRSLEGYGSLGDFARAAHSVDGYVQPLSQLFRAWLAAKFLHKLAVALSELVDELDHMNGNADCARLVGNCARDGLSNPPRRVGRELVTATPVKLVGPFH